MTLRADAQRNLDRVLDVAAECFAERGLDCSVDEIARRAGVGHGTVFRRFPTKEALVAAVVRARVRDLVKRAQAALLEPDRGAAFDEYYRWLAATYRDNRALAEGAERCGQIPELDEFHALFAKLVKRAQKARALRKDVSAEDVLSLVPAAARLPDVVLDGLRPL